MALPAAKLLHQSISSQTIANQLELLQTEKDRSFHFPIVLTWIDIYTLCLLLSIYLLLDLENTSLEG